MTRFRSLPTWTIAVDGEPITVTSNSALGAAEAALRRWRLNHPGQLFDSVEVMGIA